MAEPGEDEAVWSNVSVNGQRQTWRQMYEREKERAERLNAFAVIVSDLDRCPHGRHKGDVCSNCEGPSRGNPWQHVTGRVGTDLSGRPLVDPGRERRHDPAAWASPIASSPEEADRG